MTSLKAEALSPSRLLTGAKIAVLAGSVLAIYANDLSTLFNEALYNDLTNYILVIPFLIGYLVYRKRGALKAAISFDLSNRTISIEALEGTVLMAAALIVAWGLSFTSDPLSYRSFTIPFFTAGALLTLFGKNTLRTTLFPLALLFFMTPLPGGFTTYWGSVLSVYTTSASVAVIQVLGFSPTTSSQYGSPIVEYASLAGGQVAFAVSIACSGLYSISGFAAFSAFAAYIPRGKLLAKITLFGVGFAMVYALNIVRVVIILIMGRFYGQGAALATFHTFAGTILIFLGTLGLLFLGEKVWRLKFTRAPLKSIACKHDETHLDVLGGFCSICGRLLRFPSKLAHKREAGTILIVLSLTGLMLIAQVPLYAYTRGPSADIFSIPAPQDPPLALLPTVNLTQSSWTPNFLYRDTAFEQVATNGYVHVAWLFTYYPSNASSSAIAPDLSPANMNSNAIVPVATSIELAVPGGDAYIDPPYRSEVELPTEYNHNASYVLRPTDSVILEDPYLSGTLYIYQDSLDPGIHKVVYFWYEYATFREGSYYQQYHMLTALRARANDLSAAGLISDSTNSTQIRAIMQTFATQIVQYWVPVSSASVLSRYLTSIRQTLLPALGIAVFAAAFYAGFREVTDPVGELQLQAMINKLQTPEDKALIDEFYKKQHGETAEEARLGLSTNGYKPTLEEVVSKLTAAERLGIIRKQLSWVGEQASQRWGRPWPGLKISQIWSWRGADK